MLGDSLPLGTNQAARGQPGGDVPRLCTDGSILGKGLTRAASYLGVP